MDARKFVICNVGPIGCTPYQKAINQLNQDECDDSSNKLALQYNARLKDLLAELNDNLHGATFVLANVYDLAMEVIKNYGKYGLSLFHPLTFFFFKEMKKENNLKNSKETEE